MTEPTINFYQPAAFDGALEPLHFNGVIEQADYQRMLPRGDQEWWLFLVLAVLLGICIFVFGPLSVLFAFARGELLVGLGLIAFWTLMLAGLWSLKRRLSSSGRATRYLKMSPDLLGTALGEFTASGLSFHDGVHTFWFGPLFLLGTDIRADGIRVPLDANAHRYLALSALLFDSFSVDSANRLKRHWQKLAETPVQDEHPHGLELWNQYNWRCTAACRNVFLGRWLRTTSSGNCFTGFRSLPPHQPPHCGQPRASSRTTRDWYWGHSTLTAWCWGLVLGATAP